MIASSTSTSTYSKSLAIPVQVLVPVPSVDSVSDPSAAPAVQGKPTAVSWAVKTHLLDREFEILRCLTNLLVPRVLFLSFMYILLPLP